MTRLFAATAPGLEEVAADEAREAGFTAVEAITGGVNLQGDPLRANITLAIPNRILQRVGRFPARSFDQLVKRARAIDWSPFGGLTPVVTCRKSRLYHSGAVAERLAQVVSPGPGQLFVRINRDRCTLSVDTTGDLAHHRTWRVAGGPAPLRATLAAGILRLAGWTPGVALYDPMCGTGTLLIEAARRASGRLPGTGRTFACAGWAQSTPRVEPTEGDASSERLVRPDGRRTPAQSASIAIATPIEGCDRAERAIEAARANISSAQVQVRVHHLDARAATAPAETGLLICNPPYGKRLGDDGALRTLGELISGPFCGWRAAILSPPPNPTSLGGRTIGRRLPLRNGGLKVELLLIDP